MRRLQALDLISLSRLRCNGFVRQLRSCWDHEIDPLQMASSNSLLVCSIRRMLLHRSSRRDCLQVQVTGNRAETARTPMLKYFHRGCL